MLPHSRYVTWPAVTIVLTPTFRRRRGRGRNRRREKEEEKEEEEVDADKEEEEDGYVMFTDWTLLQFVSEDDRAFAFARIIMGDELSKRAKFVLITWSGANVGGIKRAKMSTDKSLVKNVIRVSEA